MNKVDGKNKTIYVDPQISKRRNIYTMDSIDAIEYVGSCSFYLTIN